MPARLVYEIYRRTETGRASLGLVTDDFIAKQTIDALYNELRQIVLRPQGEVQLEASGFEPNIFFDAQDWDTWSINNKNSPTPVFFFVKKTLWNAVPSSIRSWVLNETPDQFSQFPGDVPSVIVALDPQAEE